MFAVEISILSIIPSDIYDAVLCDRMRSTMGRNVQLCCERFSLRLAYATDSMFSVRAIGDLCRDKVDDDMTGNVQFIVELVKIRDNMLHMFNVRLLLA